MLIFIYLAILVMETVLNTSTERALNEWTVRRWPFSWDAAVEDSR